MKHFQKHARTARPLASTLLGAGLLFAPEAAAATTTPAAPCWSPQSPQVDYDRIQDELGQLNQIFLGIVSDSWEGRPSADKDARENAFAALDMLWMGIATGCITLPAGSAFVGGGVGTILGGSVGATAWGVGAMPGMAAGAGAGGAIGFGSGAIASGGLFMTACIVTIPIYMEIEERYPAKTAMLHGVAPQPGLLACYMNESPSLPKYAGPYESYFVHLIDFAIGDEVFAVARDWHHASGLSAAERNALGELAFLKSTIDKIAYIKTNERMSSRAYPARPLSGFLSTAKRWIQAEESAVRDAWLGAFGLGSFNMKVAKGELTLKTPAGLQAVGAPKEITQNVPGIKIPKFPSKAKGGTTDPYVRVDLSPGSFEIDFGKARVLTSGKDKDKIELSFRVKKGAKLLQGGIRYKWNGGKEQSLGKNFSPQLTSDLTGKVLLRTSGHGLEVDRVDIGALKLSTGTPKLSGVLAPLQTIVDSLAKNVKSEAGKFVKRIGVEKALEEMTQQSLRGLTALLQENPVQHGFESIAGVLGMDIENGRIRVRVNGKVYSGPSLASFNEVAKEATKRLSKAQKPRLTPRLKPLQPRRKSTPRR